MDGLRVGWLGRRPDEPQASLFQRAVVEPPVGPLLSEVRYDFGGQPALEAAAARFRAELHRLDAAHPTLLGSTEPLRIYQGIFV